MRPIDFIEWFLASMLALIAAGIIAASLSRDTHEEPEPEPWRDYSRMPQVSDETEAERREHEELTRKNP